MLNTLVISALASCIGAVPCSCIPLAPLTSRSAVTAALDAAAAVFEGTVARIEDLRVPPSTDTSVRARLPRTSDILVTVVVHRRWKGAVHDTVLVRTSAQTTACGAEFIEGRTYLVFGQSLTYSEVGTAATAQAGDTVYTSKCGPTTGAPREVRRIVGLLGQPTPRASSGRPTAPEA
jgi:hypothetical protein